MPGAVFEDADELVAALDGGNYDMNTLFAFKEKYTTNAKNNTQTLAKFITLLTKE